MGKFGQFCFREIGLSYFFQTEGYLDAKYLRDKENSRRTNGSKNEETAVTNLESGGSNLTTPILGLRCIVQINIA